LPAVIGPHVVNALVHQRMADADVLAGDLRGIELAEVANLRTVRRRVQVPQQDVRVAARADNLRETDELFIAALSLQLAPRREMSDVHVDHCPIDEDERVDRAARLSEARKRSDRR